MGCCCQRHESSAIGLPKMNNKHGKLLLLAALCILAALLLQGWIGSLRTDSADWPGTLVGNLVLLTILALAYRGGRVSLWLARAQALLFAAVHVILILFLFGTLSKNEHLPHPIQFSNTVPFLVTLCGTAFSVWALFLSSDVKDFVAYQRNRRDAAKLKLPPA